MDKFFIGSKPVLKVASALDLSQSSLNLPAQKKSGKDEVNEKQGAKFTLDDALEAVSVAQNVTQSIQRNLVFRLDEESGATIVEVRDQASGDLIRQIPTEDVIKLAKNLEEVRSLFFHERV